MALPDGLKFLQFGFWVVHALSIWLVWSWAYRQGRADERRAQRIRELEQGRR
ncbi:MAG: hypothetical protein HZC42_01775 [Candidatus Eisenbacteria bacterium]|nr:hypothetical protein [Candidatus Eisenbacteria bacterium]